MTANSKMSQTPFDLIVRKDIEWDFTEVEAVFVKADTPLISYLWAAVSAGATPIESFFIKTLLPTIETISGDEKLIRDVRDMVAQEAHHSASHRKLNQQLAAKGYDIDGLDRHFKEVLANITDGLSPKDMLGVVAAGEHSLYSIAHVYLHSRKMREQIHPQVDRLLLYHFLEEAEHGAVSHDQYRYFFGNDYFHRVKMAFRARHVLSMIQEGIRIAAKGFGHKITVRDRVHLFNYMWINPGPFRKMILPTLEYLSPWYKLTFSHEDIGQMQQWNDELYADQAVRSD